MQINWEQETEALQKVLGRHKDLYLGRDIPLRKEKNARKSHKISSLDRIWLLYDLTILGSAKHSFLITERRVSINGGSFIEFNKKQLKETATRGGYINPNLKSLPVPMCFFEWEAIEGASAEDEKLSANTFTKRLLIKYKGKSFVTRDIVFSGQEEIVSFIDRIAKLRKNF